MDSGVAVRAGARIGGTGVGRTHGMRAAGADLKRSGGLFGRKPAEVARQTRFEMDGAEAWCVADRTESREPSGQARDGLGDDHLAFGAVVGPQVGLDDGFAIAGSGRSDGDRSRKTLPVADGLGDVASGPVGRTDDQGLGGEPNSGTKLDGIVAVGHRECIGDGVETHGLFHHNGPKTGIDQDDQLDIGSQERNLGVWTEAALRRQTNVESTGGDGGAGLAFHHLSGMPAAGDLPGEGSECIRVDVGYDDFEANRGEGGAELMFLAVPSGESPCPPGIGNLGTAHCP